MKDFSITAKPLYDFIRKESEFNFGEEQLSAFEKLKTSLVSPPVLCLYPPSLETELHCDASQLGFGSVLVQKQNFDNKFHPIFYFSKRTTDYETRYHSYELECLAIIYALKRFHIYLQGIPFTIVTDCDSLRLTLNKKDICPRIMRWALYLQDYNYTIVHPSNKQMFHVDALSRIKNILVLEANTFEQTLSIKQSTDPEIVGIRIKLENSDIPFYELRNGLVYRTVGKKILFYVPNELIDNVIRICHDNMGHVGADKVVELIQNSYWFPNMKEKVKLYISKCLKCLSFTPNSGKTEGFLYPIPKGNLPFNTIHIDHLGPFEKAPRGYKYIFLVTDAFTKFVKLFLTKTTNSNEVIKHLKNYFNCYSRPIRIISDRGCAFTSTLFKDFMNENNIQLIHIATGTPRANGQAERVNSTIIPMITKLAPTISQWDKTLIDIEYVVNNTVNRSTNQAPAMLLYGVKQLGRPDDKIKMYLDSCIKSIDRDLVELRQEAANQIKKVQLQNKTNYDKKHKQPTNYIEGDLVLIRNYDVTIGANKKLVPKFLNVLI